MLRQRVLMIGDGGARGGIISTNGGVFGGVEGFASDVVLED